MIPLPIRCVLSTFEAHAVPCLIMGGQACVLYGASEFSRDLDLVIAAHPDLTSLHAALHDLQAERIAVPALDLQLLERGHAVHFRCQRNDVKDLRIDVLTHPPRVPDLSSLWAQRVLMSVPQGATVPVIGLPDLVATKRTQRDKDWSTIGLLIDADLMRSKGKATEEQIRFWLQAARSPEQLQSLAAEYPRLAAETLTTRPLLTHAVRKDREMLELALAKEQIDGKAADRAYWAPLIAELEQIRWAERREKEERP